MLFKKPTVRDEGYSRKPPYVMKAIQENRRTVGKIIKKPAAQDESV
jgi:hypothetical protein